jgi:hypothetical protein
MAHGMSDSHLMAFAVIVWMSVLALVLLVVRLMRGRPFFRSSKDSRFRDGLDRRKPSPLSGDDQGEAPGIGRAERDRWDGV